VADAAGFDLDEDLVGGGLLHRDLFECEFFAEAFEGGLFVCCWEGHYGGVLFDIGGSCEECGDCIVVIFAVWGWARLSGYIRLFCFEHNKENRSLQFNGRYVIW